MSFGIVLNESDLREMPSDIRVPLLKWYFDRSPSSVNSTPTPIRGVTVPPSASVPRRQEKGRVSFQELVRAGLIAPGNEIVCRTLRRQQRGGAGEFVEAGNVVEDGSVEYRGRRYDIPSKLAITVINAKGGEARSVNGYDYILVRSSNGLVPLSELRDEFLRRSS